MSGVETAREVLVALTRRYAFGEVAAMVGAGAAGADLTTGTVAQIQQLCAYGQRLLDLDAEDLADPDAAAGANTDQSVAARVSGDAVPAHLIARGRACRMPQSPRERDRGALTSLRPAFRLLLEVIDVRWRRRETAAVVAGVHIASEYAPLVAWEKVLGHAADPVLLAADPAFDGRESLFGRYDEPACPHIRPQRSAANRALRAASESPNGWRAYLDRQHSHVASALAVCATECRSPCTVVIGRRQEHRGWLAESCRAATALGQSQIVRLRHSAPVGHGFGVPSPDEVRDAWSRSRETIAKEGRVAGAVLIDDGYPLPGLPSLFGAIAGTDLSADTLLADTAAEIITTLGPVEPA